MKLHEYQAKKLFADYGIPNPSFGAVSTEDHGSIEFLMVFAK